MTAANTISATSVKIRDRASLRQKWGWFFALGCGLMLLGLGAIGTPFAASMAIALFVGTLLLISGVIQLIHAFRLRQGGDFIGEMLLSIIGILVGLYMLANPLLSISVLALILGGYLIIEGVSKTYIAFRWRPLPGWQWGLLNGILAVIIGIMIIMHWPFDSLWIFGLFLGFNFLFMGISCTMLGLSLRRLA